MEHPRNHEVQRARERYDELMLPRPTVIAIEGGPCGGKTTLVESIRAAAGSRPVVCLPEVASDVIGRLADDGVDFTDIMRHNRDRFLDIETKILAEIASSIDAARQAFAGTDAIVIADRCDIGAYVSADEYHRILSRLEIDLPPLLGQVDKVFYLPSVARIDAGAYEHLRATNVSRYEDLYEAQQTCERNLAAVARHPELQIRWGGDFDASIRALTDAILTPERERELRLRPAAPNLAKRTLDSAELLESSRIIQSYHVAGAQQFRLRQVVTERDERTYWFTVKTGSGLTRHETQRKITRGDYQLLAALPCQGEVLEKNRTQLLLNDPSLSGSKRLWSVDVYQSRLKGYWTMETDVESDEEAARLTTAMSGFCAASLSAAELATSSLPA